MKITDAFWEERNLGLKVCEIIFDVNDQARMESISELERSYDYLVAKVPGGSIPLIHNLESLGFRYLENQLVFYVLTQELLSVGKIWQNRFSDILCEKIKGNEDLISICSGIMQGLYTTGRISADPEIKCGVSDLRIVNWLNDLTGKENIIILKLVKENLLIGYFVLERISRSHVNVVQAGIFKDFQKKGYSFLIPFNILKIAYSTGAKGIFASVSSDNLNMINSMSKIIRLSIRETYVVLRKMTRDKRPGEGITIK